MTPALTAGLFLPSKVLVNPAWGALTIDPKLAQMPWPPPPPLCAKPRGVGGACGQDEFRNFGLPQVGAHRPPPQRRRVVIQQSRAKLSGEESDDSLGIDSARDSEDSRRRSRCWICGKLAGSKMGVRGPNVDCIIQCQGHLLEIEGAHHETIV